MYHKVENSFFKKHAGAGLPQNFMKLQSNVLPNRRRMTRRLRYFWYVIGKLSCLRGCSWIPHNALDLFQVGFRPCRHLSRMFNVSPSKRFFSHTSSSLFNPIVYPCIFKYFQWLLSLGVVITNSLRRRFENTIQLERAPRGAPRRRRSLLVIVGVW